MPDYSHAHTRARARKYERMPNNPINIYIYIYILASPGQRIHILFGTDHLNDCMAEGDYLTKSSNPKVCKDQPSIHCANGAHFHLPYVVYTIRGSPCKRACVRELYGHWLLGVTSFVPIAFY